MSPTYVRGLRPPGKKWTRALKTGMCSPQRRLWHPAAASLEPWQGPQMDWTPLPLARRNRSSDKRLEACRGQLYYTAAGVWTAGFFLSPLFSVTSFLFQSKQFDIFSCWRTSCILNSDWSTPSEQTLGTLGLRFAWITWNMLILRVPPTGTFKFLFKCIFHLTD